MLVKICVCDVDSTVKLKSKITVVNNVSSFADFLRTVKLDDGSYLSLENLQEVLVRVAPIATALTLIWSALKK